MATIKMTRTFRLNGIDLPDPDSDLTPEQVLEFYAQQHPSLRHGKVSEQGSEGDQLVYKLEPNEFKPNG